MRRAGLDYHEWANVKIHENYDDFLSSENPKVLYAASTKGTQRYDKPNYQPGDFIMFGPETRGLPQDVRESLPAEHVVRLPMKADSRSLNLSNSVAIFVFEAWRQLDFEGCQ